MDPHDVLDEAEGPPVALSIQDVSSLLEVPAPTIRSWERRYAIPSPSRSDGGHRRYSPADVTTLRVMRDEVARGQRAIDAAAWARDQTSRPLPRQSTIDELIEAARRLDRPRFLEVLDASAEREGIDVTTCGVLLPAMRRIGVWWQASRCDVAHERLASETAIAWLHRVPQPEGTGVGVVLLACGPSDQHTIGLESLAALLRQRGSDARTLGARVPAASLRVAVESSGASAAIVVSHLAVARRSAIESLTAASAAATELFYAGNAFSSHTARRGVPGLYLGDDFVAAADTIMSVLGARRSA